MKAVLLIISLLFFSIFTIRAQKARAPIEDVPGLVFSYDEAGNQINREFYKTIDHIHIDPKKNMKEQAEPDSKTDIVLLEDKFIIYPNPTTGETTLSWDQSVTSQIETIKIVGYNSLFYRDVPFNSSDINVDIDINNELKGVYFVQFTLNDGKLVTKKLIKN